LGNNINSNNFLEVLIAGVKLTPRVKYVSKCKGTRRVKTLILKRVFFLSIRHEQSDKDKKTRA